jgi:hypothetical protein
MAQFARIDPTSFSPVAAVCARNPALCMQVSLAAHGLACWVHGIEAYDKAAKALFAARQQACFADYASLKSCAAPDDLVAPDTPPANGAANQVGSEQPPDQPTPPDRIAVGAVLQAPPPA